MNVPNDLIESRVAGQLSRALDSTVESGSVLALNVTNMDKDTILRHCACFCRTLSHAITIYHYPTQYISVSAEMIVTRIKLLHKTANRTCLCNLSRYYSTYYIWYTMSLFDSALGRWHTNDFWWQMRQKGGRVFATSMYESLSVIFARYG